MILTLLPPTTHPDAYHLPVNLPLGFTALKNKISSYWLSGSKKYHEKTLVWYANGDNPAPEGSKVGLTSDGQFLLTIPQGIKIWRPHKSVTTATHADMLDTGNLVLTNRNQNDILTV